MDVAGIEYYLTYLSRYLPRVLDTYLGNLQRSAWLAEAQCSVIALETSIAPVR